jgi:hypothetical protein
MIDCLYFDAVVQVPGAVWHTYDMEVQVVLEAAWSFRLNYFLTIY